MISRAVRVAGSFFCYSGYGGLKDQENKAVNLSAYWM